jgi:Membrane bound O-acyl transferase family
MKLKKIAAIALIVLGLVSLGYLRLADPLIRLIAASIGMIWVIKVAAVIWQQAEGIRFESTLGLVAYFTVWPGIAIEGFTERKIEPSSEVGNRFLSGWLTFLSGVGVLLFASWMGQGHSDFYNYLGLSGVLLMIHLGFMQVLADGLRLLGFSPKTLFDQPLSASSLRDFWSLRWNQAFVDMNRIFLLGPLKNRIPPQLLIFSIFLVSGLLHEMGISYPDGVSWGKPLLYFVIQGLGMLLERKVKFPRLLVWIWILSPSLFLFTPAFTHLFLGRLTQAIYLFMSSHRLSDWFHYGLVLGGFFNLMVLGASVQVPEKLGWKKDFAQLSSMNRKVFWTYGGYIFSIILFMAIVSFSLSVENRITGSVSVFLWLCFIAMFWWARVLIDFFFMKDEDWPRGPLFRVGHICLSTLFLTLAGLYSLLAAMEVLC